MTLTICLLIRDVVHAVALIPRDCWEVRYTVLYDIAKSVTYSTYRNSARLYTYGTYYVWRSQFYISLRGTFPENVSTYYLQKTLITHWVKYIIIVLLIPARNVVRNVCNASYVHANNTLHKLYVLYAYS